MKKQSNGFGNLLKSNNAKSALQYLVRQAIAGQPIHYSELADLIGIPNPRNTNMILGEIGNALITLSEKTGKKIPTIQALVISKKNNLPSHGIEYFLRENYNNLSSSDKENIIKNVLSDIFTFQDWPWVLEMLGLKPIGFNLDSYIKRSKSKKGGESEDHKKFKRLISENPDLVSLGKRVEKIDLEYRLPSSDTIDVLFVNKGEKIGVEVKSKISDTADVLRGLFQCLKYKHLLHAEMLIENNKPNCRVILAVEGKFPEELEDVRILLGIKVIDNIGDNYKEEIGQ